MRGVHLGERALEAQRRDVPLVHGLEFVEFAVFPEANDLRVLRSGDAGLGAEGYGFVEDYIVFDESHYQESGLVLLLQEVV